MGGGPQNGNVVSLITEDEWEKIRKAAIVYVNENPLSLDEVALHKRSCPIRQGQLVCTCGE